MSRGERRWRPRSPRDQGRQSQKRRFSAESGGVHRGSASGHSRYGKNTQDEALLLQTSQALFDYLDSLKP